MKAIQTAKRTAALGLSALVLSSVMLCGVSCTRDDHKNPSDTTAPGTNKPSVTTPVTDKNDSTGASTDKPLDPDAGTVAPDGNESKDSRSILPRFMK